MNTAIGDVWAVGLGSGVQRVNQPHHDAAHEQRGADDIETLEMLTNDLGQQEGRACGDHEGHHDQAQRVGQGGAVAAFSLRKGGEELDDAVAEVNWQTEDRTELDDNGVHFPITVAQTDVEQRLRHTQVRGRTDGQEFGQAFDDSQDSGKQVVVQDPSKIKVSQKQVQMRLAGLVPKATRCYSSALP